MTARGSAWGRGLKRGPHQRNRHDDRGWKEPEEQRPSLGVPTNWIFPVPEVRNSRSRQADVDAGAEYVYRKKGCNLIRTLCEKLKM
jgi:hypothetical protein